MSSNCIILKQQIYMLNFCHLDMVSGSINTYHYSL